MKSYSLIYVKEALMYGNEQEQNIRAKLFAEARDGSKWEEIRTSEFYKEMVEEITAQAEKFLLTPITAIPYSKYRLFSENGNRSEYQEYYFERRARLNVFAFLSMLYGEKRYIEPLEDAIWAICDEYTWCLPAHLPNGGNEASYGENAIAGGGLDILIEKKEHKRVIDLFNAETGFALTEIMSLLEGKLSPLVVERARREVRERILDSFCMLRSMSDWETKTNNWAAVCGGSVGTAAMYLIDDYSVLAPIIYKVLGAIESFLSGYGDDGMCKEGLSYWNYGFGFFVCFSELLKQRTCGKIDLMDDEKVREIALYQQRVILGEDRVVSFSDSKGFLKVATGHTHRLKERFKEVLIPDIRYREKFDSDTSRRWSRMIRNFIWSRCNYEGFKLEDCDCYYKDSQWFMSRVSTEAGIISFAGKWGNNGEPHNHNDVGSFVLYKNGDTILTDLGASNYTRQNFSSGRYSIFGNGSQGHSLPIIEGSVQREGADRAAAVLEKLISPELNVFAAELSGAYDDGNLESLVRKYIFHKDKGIRLELKDSFRFVNAPSSVVERFITYHRPVEIEKGTIRIGKEDNHILLKYSAGDLTFECGTHSHNSHNNQKGIVEEVFSVDLHSRRLEKNMDITVEFILS